MASPAKKPRHKSNVVEFVDEVPPVARGQKWTALLLPLSKNPGRPAMIHEASTPEMANSTRGNLVSRAVKIPYPDHEWSFYARGCEVFAIYKGKPSPIRKRVSK